MDARKNAVKNVPPKILTAEANNFCSICCGLVGEQGDDGRCYELNGHRGENTKTYGNYNCVTQCLNRTFRLLGANILCAQH